MYRCSHTRGTPATVVRAVLHPAVWMLVVLASIWLNAHAQTAGTAGEGVAVGRSPVGAPGPGVLTLPRNLGSGSGFPRIELPWPPAGTPPAVRPSICDICMDPSVRPKPPTCAYILCSNPLESDPGAAGRSRQTLGSSRTCEACRTVPELGGVCVPQFCGGSVLDRPTSTDRELFRRWTEVFRVEVDQLRSQGVLDRARADQLLDAYRVDNRANRLVAPVPTGR